MERLIYRISIVRTGRGIFRRRRPPQLVQESSSAMSKPTEPAVITLLLSLYKNMKMELAWRSQHLRTQFKEVHKTLKRLKEKFLTDDFQETTESSSVHH